MALEVLPFSIGIIYQTMLLYVSTAIGWLISPLRVVEQAVMYTPTHIGISIVILSSFSVNEKVKKS
jgi:hypothetical protein